MAPFPAFHWSLLYHSMTHLDVSDQLMPVDAGSHIWLSFKDQKWKLSKSNIVQKLCKVSTVVRWLKSNKLLYLAQKLSETFNNFLIPFVASLAKSSKTLLNFFLNFVHLETFFFFGLSETFYVSQKQQLNFNFAVLKVLDLTRLLIPLFFRMKEMT